MYIYIYKVDVAIFFRIESLFRIIFVELMFKHDN